MAKSRRTFARPKSRIALVRNRSDRLPGVDVDLIVIHSTESGDRPGTADVDGVRNWFDNPASRASSHVIVDAEGNVVTCVPDEEKAWTQASFNSRSLSVELIGFASLKRWQWLKRRRQLKAAARFVAYWSMRHAIPVRRCHAERPGVCAHADLGALGGGHHDPGVGFPWDRLLRHATWYRANGWVN